MKTVNLFNKYLLLVTCETNDNYSIQFDSKFQKIAQLFDSIWNEKTLFTTTRSSTVKESKSNIKGAGMSLVLRWEIW